MAKTALINARTEPDLKQEVEGILKKLGTLDNRSHQHLLSSSQDEKRLALPS